MPVFTKKWCYKLKLVRFGSCLHFSAATGTGTRSLSSGPARSSGSSSTLCRSCGIRFSNGICFSHVLWTSDEFRTAISPDEFRTAISSDEFRTAISSADVVPAAASASVPSTVVRTSTTSLVLRPSTVTRPPILLNTRHFSKIYTSEIPVFIAVASQYTSDYVSCIKLRKKWTFRYYLSTRQYEKHSITWSRAL